MTAKEILEEIKPLGGAGYKKVIYNHGVKEPCYGVKNRGTPKDPEAHQA